MAAGMTAARFLKTSCAFGPGSAVLISGNASLSDIIVPPKITWNYIDFAHTSWEYSQSVQVDYSKQKKRLP
jgi:hypothetical protein